MKLGKGKRASSSESDENEYVAVKILDRRQFEEVAVKKEIAVHKVIFWQGHQFAFWHLTDY